MLLALSAAGGISAAGHLAPATDCSNFVLSMADCLSYVTTGSRRRSWRGLAARG
ncbi:hypothetical protein PHJA_001871100 [Phtheirospermum japonicum]|uniref:Uncharacterized protein n=1 Tax=Phtheirospermum japonicum TaxID=374723 RepID=A0A830CCD1_9LAMI|nr:hypothetical protein PHJA_001871100 [Phtheirospermum japonicum]